jgi:hypothetical protein
MIPLPLAEIHGSGCESHHWPIPLPLAEIDGSGHEYHCWLIPLMLMTVVPCQTLIIHLESNSLPVYSVSLLEVLYNSIPVLTTVLIGCSIASTKPIS